MKWIQSIKLILTLRCEEASRIMSDSMDRDLGFAERWAIRLHVISCRHCVRLRRHLRVIRDAAKKLAEKEFVSKEQLQTSKNRIAKRLKEQ